MEKALTTFGKKSVERVCHFMCDSFSNLVQYNAGLAMKLILKRGINCPQVCLTADFIHKIHKKSLIFIAIDKAI